MEYNRERYRKEHPNVRPQSLSDMKERCDSYYDFETHRELAINSGIEYIREWRECHTRGFMPDGIYRNPDKTFNPKYSSKEKAL